MTCLQSIEFLCLTKNDPPTKRWVFHCQNCVFLVTDFMKKYPKKPCELSHLSIPSMGTRTLLSLVLLCALTNPPFMNEWTIWFTARHCLKRICLHWFPQECKLTVLAADWLILASMAISETKKYWISFNLERTVCRKKISRDIEYQFL